MRGKKPGNPLFQQHTYTHQKQADMYYNMQQQNKRNKLSLDLSTKRNVPVFDVATTNDSAKQSNAVGLLLSGSTAKMNSSRNQKYLVVSKSGTTTDQKSGKVFKIKRK